MNIPVKQSTTVTLSAVSSQGFSSSFKFLNSNSELCSLSPKSKLSILRQEVGIDGKTVCLHLPVGLACDIKVFEVKFVIATKQEPELKVAQRCEIGQMQTVCRFSWLRGRGFYRQVKVAMRCLTSCRTQAAKPSITFSQPAVGRPLDACFSIATKTIVYHLWAHICLLLEGAKRRTDCFERTEVGNRPWKPDSSHEGWMQLATTSGHRGPDSTCILGSVQLATLAFTKTRCSSAPFAASQEVARKIYVKGIKSFTRGKHQWPPAQILPVIDCFALSVDFNHPLIVTHALENRLARA